MSKNFIFIQIESINYLSFLKNLTRVGVGRLKKGGLLNFFQKKKKQINNFIYKIAELKISQQQDQYLKLDSSHQTIGNIQVFIHLIS